VFQVNGTCNKLITTWTDDENNKDILFSAAGPFTGTSAPWSPSLFVARKDSEDLRYLVGGWVQLSPWAVEGTLGKGDFF
jgi:hypothetical protein